MPNYYDLNSILSCSYGTTSLSVVNCKVKEEAVVTDYTGRSDTKITITAECLLACTTNETDFAALVQTALADVRTDGRDFFLYGIGGTQIYSLLAATCENGAPHVTFEMLDGKLPLQKIFNLTIFASSFNIKDSKDGKFTNNFKLSTATRPDGLVTITQTGEMHGPTNATFFLSKVLTAFSAAYPNPNWVVDTKYETGASGLINQLSYEMVARQNYGPLPTSGTSVAVDGEVSSKTDRDEQMRLMTTISVDLIIVGDPIPLITFIRTLGPAGQPIFKEQFSVTTVRERRITGSFSVLTSGDQSPLLNWTESYTIHRAADYYEQRTYPGPGPILVKANSQLSKITQSGSAIGAGQFPKEPKQLLDINAAMPEVTFDDVNNVEKKTNWRYEMWYMGVPTGVSPGSGGNAGNTGGALPPTFTPPLGALSRAMGPSGIFYSAHG